MWLSSHLLLISCDPTQWLKHEDFFKNLTVVNESAIKFDVSAMYIQVWDLKAERLLNHQFQQIST
jgi:hypothetical protein